MFVRRHAIDLFIAVMLVLFLIDGLPVLGSAHQWMKNAIDPLLDKTGLWQGSWQLFAPEPQKSTVRLHADIAFEDGRHVSWSSPDWATMPVADRLTSFRWQEYVDHLGDEANAAAWPGLADYLVRTVRPSGDSRARAVRVTLDAEYTEVPPPASGERQPPRGPRRHDARKTLHVRTYAP